MTTTPPTNPTTLITGANRGIGLEFARQLKARNHTLIATARNPDNAAELRSILTDADRLEKLDVSRDDSCAELAQRLDGTPVGLLINNAGIGSHKAPVTELDTQDLAHVLNVNAIGPMRTIKHLLPLMRLARERTGEGGLILNISSQLGSIANNTGGSSYAYRASKATLNMLTKHLAIELADEGFTVITAHPGWVQTDMGGKQAHLTPEQSVGNLIDHVIAPATTDTHNGTYRNFDGTVLPW